MLKLKGQPPNNPNIEDFVSFQETIGPEGVPTSMFQAFPIPMNQSDKVTKEWDGSNNLLQQQKTWNLRWSLSKMWRRCQRCSHQILDSWLFVWCIVVDTHWKKAKGITCCEPWLLQQSWQGRFGFHFYFVLLAFTSTLFSPTIMETRKVWLATIGKTL